MSCVQSTSLPDLCHCKPVSCKGSPWEHTYAFGVRLRGILLPLFPSEVSALRRNIGNRNSFAQ